MLTIYRTLLFIPLIWLVGCLNFGKNYSYRTTEKPPLAEIEKWLGAPLPSSYSDLKYEIISDTPDPQVRIAVKVPEEYFQTLINNKKLIKYDNFQNKLPYDIKPRELPDSDLIKKPLPTTTIWMTKNDFYPIYYWYQKTNLYLVYSSR